VRQVHDADGKLLVGCRQERQGHVVDGHVGGRPALEGAVVGVTVEDSGNRIAGEGLFETARAEKREDLEGLTFNGRADRRLVEENGALGGAEPGERAL
jgi:hypothetical protein